MLKCILIMAATYKKLLLLPLIALCSCKGSWDEDDKKVFYQSCLDEAKGWVKPEKAKPYCDCVLDKVLAKYPNESDALEHIDSVINDPAVAQCKVEASRD